MNLAFRLGTKDDLQGLKKLAIKSWTPYQKELTNENWSSLKQTISNEKIFANLIDQSTCFICVADNDNIIGMAFLVPNGNPTDIYLREWSYIRFVSVDPEFGGQGVGRKLTTLCIDKANENGEKTIALHTSEIMKNARHIYESLGFEIVREIDQRLGKRYWLYKLDLNRMKIILIPLILIVLTSCQPFLKTKKSQITNAQHVEKNNISNEFSNWVDAVNNKRVEIIKACYLPESIKIISSDRILSGPDEIADFYALQSEGIKSISSLFIVKANKEKNIDYELIKYETLNGKLYAQLVIWRVKNGVKFREFEFVSEISEETHTNEKSITEKRDLWIELCNAHTPEDLVNTLYSSNSIYFNHKPIIRGHENLIKEYGYMKDANYRLTLHPLKMFFVNDKLVYEIGQCEGTYNGKYILIWKKESDGEWRVFIDSNS